MSPVRNRCKIEVGEEREKKKEVRKKGKKEGRREGRKTAVIQYVAGVL